MRAIVYGEYGPPDVLELQEVEQPSPTGDEVLVRVHASSINSWDWDILTGTLQGRIGGLRKPRYPILGADIAGRVEAVGKNVTDYRVGDEVFGDISADGWGGLAEYVSVSETALAPKPKSATFEQAAAMAQAAVLALQGLRHKGRIQPGQHVLINGAGGGVGTFAVQLAKLFGAEVTAVDLGGKLDLLSSIGSDHVIDHTQEDFTRSGIRYDLVLDVVATRSTFAHRRALTLAGRYVVVGGTTGVLAQTLVLGPVLGLGGTRKTSVLTHQPNRQDLTYLSELFSSGSVLPIIDSSYPLSESAEAFRHFGGGQHTGKIVIEV